MRNLKKEKTTGEKFSDLIKKANKNPDFNLGDQIEKLVLTSIQKDNSFKKNKKKPGVFKRSRTRNFDT